MTGQKDTTDRLIDGIRDPFTRVPNRFVDAFVYLSPAAVKLWVYLRRKVNIQRNRNASAWPSYDTMQRDISLGRAAISRAIKELKRHGWLRTQKRFSRSTVYLTTLGSKTGTDSSSEIELIQFDSATTAVRKANPNKTNQNKNQTTTSGPTARTAHAPNGAGDGLSDSEAVVLRALKGHGVHVNRRSLQLARAIAKHSNALPEIARLHAELSANSNVNNLAGLLLETLSNHDWSIPTASTVAPMKSAVMHYEQ